jgi:hypothetical protein
MFSAHAETASQNPRASAQSAVRFGFQELTAGTQLATKVFWFGTTRLRIGTSRFQIGTMSISIGTKGLSIGTKSQAGRANPNVFNDECRLTGLKADTDTGIPKPIANC